MNGTSNFRGMSRTELSGPGLNIRIQNSTGHPKLNLLILQVEISLASLKQIVVEREKFISHSRFFKIVVVAGVGSVV